MTYLTASIPLTDEQRETIEDLTGSPIEFAYVRSHGTDDVLVSHSMDHAQYEWVVGVNGSVLSQKSRLLDIDGWSQDI